MFYQHGLNDYTIFPMGCEFSVTVLHNSFDGISHFFEIKKVMSFDQVLKLPGFPVEKAVKEGFLLC